MGGFIVLVVLTAVIRQGAGVCSPVYGASNPCSFVPALPGSAPDCAKPGFTYCEHPTHYPGELIKHLVHKWRYDHSTLLIDESRLELDNFYMKASDTPYGVDPHHQQSPAPAPVQDSYAPTPANLPGPPIGGSGYLPPPVSPKPVYGPPAFAGNRYIPPPPQSFSPINNTIHQQGNVPTNSGNNCGGYRCNFNPANHLFSQKVQNSRIPFAHSRYFPANNLPIGVQYKSIESPQVNSYNRDFNKRYNNPNEKYFYGRRRRRSIDRLRMRTLQDTFATANGTAGSLERMRRQATAGGDGGAQTLCTARSQYIMPRAALNNRGNWMYVVNMPEVDNRLSQLVKSEVCTSQQCNGICSLPNGYTSRCEQKYVQKRLVALEGAGSQLYTDVFWFPSCCICTITRN